MRRLDIRIERFPIRGAFTISRGSKTEAQVVTVRLTEAETTGWAESVPYGRYGETLESVTGQIENIRAELEAGCSRADLARLLPAGAARNAIDCALWDLEARQRGVPVWQLAGLQEPQPVATAYTLSLGTPEAMAEAARNAPGTDLLKLKLGGENDLDRLRAVRAAAPAARFIVDANEGWDFRTLERLAPQCAELGVVLIEQPLPAADDHVLTRGRYPVRICADESCHTSDDIDRLADRYDAVNIKLDKTGGLTEAIRTLDRARSHNLEIMVGCMVGSSLGMAPAVLLTPYAAFVDLDGPLLLDADRSPSLCYERGQIVPAQSGLWG